MMNPLDRISLAQDFFRFAYSVGLSISVGMEGSLPPPLGLAVWGKHSLDESELTLTAEEIRSCGSVLNRLAYRLLAMELDSAMAACFAGNDRFNHIDEFVRDASIVVRLVRNAVAHNVLDPVWKIDRKVQSRVISIDGVLTFDITKLKNGQRLDRFDFGGPIALFRLSEMIAARLRGNGSV